MKLPKIQARKKKQDNDQIDSSTKGQQNNT